jgi:hypothetical protein
LNSDVDGSGVMNSTKLREVFVAFGLGELSDSEIDLLMRATDLDGDGVINLGTYCYLMILYYLMMLSDDVGHVMLLLDDVGHVNYYWMMWDM